MKPIEERLSDFKQLVWDSIGRNFNLYDKETIIEFVEYWTEKSPRGLTMRFEREIVFDVKRRLSTWKRNQETGFGRYKPGTKIPRTWPNTLNKSLLKRLDGNDWWEYVKHLKSLGYAYNSSPTGSHFKTPSGKIEWIS